MIAAMAAAVSAISAFRLISSGGVGFSGGWAVASFSVGALTVGAELFVALGVAVVAVAVAGDTGAEDMPVSSLIVAAFPVVYAQLLRSTGDEDFKRLPALLTLPLSFFVDWDRAKSARHELVDKFLYSSWPPADLLLTSMAAGIQEKTLRRLARSYRGADYMMAIDRDSHRLTPQQFSDVQNCLRRFSH
jgi:hypothetical protein